MFDFESENKKLYCFDDQQMQMMLDHIYAYFQAKDQEQSIEPFLTERQAMELMKIKSDNTLRKYRAEGKIQFKKLSNGKVLYNHQSILDFLNKPETIK